MIYEFMNVIFFYKMILYISPMKNIFIIRLY